MTRELEDDDDCEQLGDDEPSLGSFDRMTDQSKSYGQTENSAWMSGLDVERDDADFEGNNCALEESDTGVGDNDGLDEQVPVRGWQNVGMV